MNGFNGRTGNGGMGSSVMPPQGGGLTTDPLNPRMPGSGVPGQPIIDPRNPRMPGPGPMIMRPGVQPPQRKPLTVGRVLGSNATGS